MTDYNYRLEPWFPPKTVLRCYHMLFKIYGENAHDSLFRRAHEMAKCAYGLLGIYELDNSNLYYMQSNNQTPTPDVVAGKQIKTPQVDLAVVNIEETEMDDNSPEDDPMDFLLRTKLSPTANYTKDDLILLSIRKKVSLNLTKFHMDLAKFQPNPSIFIIGKPTEKSVGNFTIHRVFPDPSEIKSFNVSDTLKKYFLPESVVFGRKIVNEISYSGKVAVNIKIREVLGLSENLKKIEQKFPMS